MVQRSKKSRSSRKRAKATSRGHDCKFCKVKNIPYYTFYRKHRTGDCLKIHFSAVAATWENEIVSSHAAETTPLCVEGNGDSSVDEGNDAITDDDQRGISGDYGTATCKVVDSAWVQRHGPFYTGMEAVAVSVSEYDSREALHEKVLEQSDATVGEVIITLSQLQIEDGVSRDTANKLLNLLHRVGGAGACKALPRSVNNVRSMINVPPLHRFTIRYCTNCCHVLSSVRCHQYTTTEDGCPTCQQFSSSLGASMESESNGWAFYLGVENAIQMLFTSDSFRRKRGCHRTIRDPSTLWGSKAWRKIDSDLKRLPLTDEEGNAIAHVGLFHQDASPYSIFVDSYILRLRLATLVSTWFF